MDARDEASLLAVRLSKAVAPALAPLRQVPPGPAPPAMAALHALAQHPGGAEDKRRRAKVRARHLLNMYVPSWPGLSPASFFRSGAPKELPFPLSASHATYFFRARNAIYHLFRALALTTDETAPVPDYHSGNGAQAARDDPRFDIKHLL